MKAPLKLVLSLFWEAKFEIIKRTDRSESIDFVFFVDRLNTNIAYSYTENDGLQTAMLLIRSIEYQIGYQAGQRNLQNEFKKLLNLNAR